MSKLGLKTGGPPCYFLSTRSQKINEYYKNWAKKIEDVFVYIFGFLFYGISHAKTDWQNKYDLPFWKKVAMKINYCRSMRKDDVNLKLI